LSLAKTSKSLRWENTRAAALQVIDMVRTEDS
jgi:hypothetical protein